jgi:hypothetical protein
MEEKNAWKEAGKDAGHTIAELGKAIVRSVKVGAERILDEDPNKNVDLRESWSNVGKSFGTSGKSLGKAVAKTARVVADKLDSEETENVVDAVYEELDPEEEKKEEPKDGETANEHSEEL